MIHAIPRGNKVLPSNEEIQIFITVALAGGVSQLVRIFSRETKRKRNGWIVLAQCAQASMVAFTTVAFFQDKLPRRDFWALLGVAFILGWLGADAFKPLARALGAFIGRDLLGEEK